MFVKLCSFSVVRVSLIFPQATLPASATEAPIRAPNDVSATFGTRRGQQIALDIERLDAIIQSQKAHATQKAATTAVASASANAATASVVVAAAATGTVESVMPAVRSLIHNTMHE